MKRYFIAILIIVCASACNSNPGDTKKATVDSNALPATLVSNPNTANGIDTAQLATMATIDLKDTLHDFGTIQEGETAEYDFAFTNNGKMPLVITDATGSCGCTIPAYPHDPVAPGKSGIIKVKFNSAGKEGHQEKSVTIASNAKRSISMLYIKAEVNAAKK
jgi:hypothetical protein